MNERRAVTSGVSRCPDGFERMVMRSVLALNVHPSVRGSASVSRSGSERLDESGAKRNPNDEPISEISKIFSPVSAESRFLRDSRRTEVMAIFPSDVFLLHVLEFRQFTVRRNFRSPYIENAQHVIYLGVTCWKSIIVMSKSLPAN